MLNIVYSDIICIFNIAVPFISGTCGDHLQVLTMYDTVKTFKILVEGFTLFLNVLIFYPYKRSSIFR